MLSKVQKGDSAVLWLSAVMVEQGLTLLKPLSEAVPFDLVLYRGEKFYRIQVKRAQKYKDTGRFDIPFRKITVNSSGVKTYRYDASHADFLAGVVIETGDVYVFPIRETMDIKVSIQVDPRGVSVPLKTKRIDPEQYRNRIVVGDESVVLVNKS